MSRSTLPKSRTDRAKATSATPAVAHEIIPGKYNDQDWNFMLDHDDGDDFICDIVEEVCSSAMDIIFKAHVEKELIPYTVCQAKDAILQIIEWQFLCRDSGELEVESDAGWLQDEEPEPSVTDCWAQGSVPRHRTTPRLLSAIGSAAGTPSLAEVDEEPEALYEQQAAVTPTVEQEEVYQSPEPQLLEENSLPMEESEPSSPAAATEPTSQAATEPTSQAATEPTSQAATPQPPTQSEKSSAKKKAYKPKAGRLPPPQDAKLTESLDDTEVRMSRENEPTPHTQTPDPDSLHMPASCHSMLKLQAGRPPGNRDVIFDEQGNVISVYRLDPEKLPNHKVRTTYRVVDPAVEAAQARLEAMRTGRRVERNMAPRPPNAAKPSMTRGLTSKTSSKTHTVIATSSKHTSRAIDIAPLPPPMLDTMELMPGVVVKEGDRIKRGPRPYGRKMEVMLSALHDNLKPMSSRADLPTLSVAELLEHHTPVVKPLVDNSPIPPIAAQTQYS